MIEQFVTGQLVVFTLNFWLQQPLWHAGVVQMSPSVSVHGEPFVAGDPLTQTPPWQVSFKVHSLPSLQDAPLSLLVKLHVPSPLQVPGFWH